MALNQGSDRAIRIFLWRLQPNANTVNDCFMQRPPVPVDRFRALAFAFSIVHFPPGAETAQGRIETVSDQAARGHSWTPAAISSTDRTEDMIVVSGFKVFPNEIEDFAMMYAGVLEATAVGATDPKSGKVVKLFVIREDPKLTEQALLEHCRKNLTGYKVPKIVEFRDGRCRRATSARSCAGCCGSRCRRKRRRLVRTWTIRDSCPRPASACLPRGRGSGLQYASHH
jgi:hypothetical protein